MNFKKKRSFRDLLLAVLVVFLGVVVPAWIFVIATISGSTAVWMVLVAWVFVCYLFGGRFEEWLT
jgi:hypothetical protein